MPPRQQPNIQPTGNSSFGGGYNMGGSAAGPQEPIVPAGGNGGGGSGSFGNF